MNLLKRIAALATTGVTACLASHASAQTFGFEHEYKTDLTPEFNTNVLKRALGNLDSDNLPDCAFATNTSLGVLMGPGHYTVHESVNSTGGTIEDIAILENHVSQTGGTIFAVEGGRLRSYRYVDGPNPSIDAFGVGTQTDAKALSTWSSDHGSATYGFVALVQSTSIRLLIYFQETGVFFDEQFSVNVVASDAALVDVDADGQPEQHAFTSSGVNVYDNAGGLDGVYGNADMSSVDDVVLLRHPANGSSPKPEAVMWTTPSNGQSMVHHLSQDSQDVLTYTVNTLPETAGVWPIDYDENSYNDAIALRTDGSWTIGVFNHVSGSIQWDVLTGQLDRAAARTNFVDLVPPMAHDFDGDGDWDLLTCSANEDSIHDPDRSDDGPDIHFWPNTKIDANRRKVNIRDITLDRDSGNGGGNGRGPSLPVDDTAIVRLSIDSPPDLEEMEFSHIVVRLWRGGDGVPGTKNMIVEAQYEQGVVSTESDPPLDWATGPVLLPPDGSPDSLTIPAGSSSSAFTTAGWDLGLTLPFDKIMYFQVICVNNLGTEVETMYPSRFYALYVSTDTLGLDVEPHASLRDWHHVTGSAGNDHLTEIPLAPVAPVSGWDPLPIFYEIGGTTLRICGYVISP